MVENISGVNSSKTVAFYVRRRHSYLCYMWDSELLSNTLQERSNKSSAHAREAVSSLHALCGRAFAAPKDVNIPFSYSHELISPGVCMAG